MEEAEAAIGQLEPDFGPVGQFFLISMMSREFMSPELCSPSEARPAIQRAVRKREKEKQLN